MNTVTVKHPSNSSTTDKGLTPHSGFIAARSNAYHTQTVSPTYTRHSSTKMTRAQHQLNNDEDMSELGHKL